MNIRLSDVISLVKELPENYLEETFEKLKEIKDRADSVKENKSESCPKCGSDKVVRNGKRNKRQAYLCRDCKKTFVESSKSAIAYSHGSETVWKQVIRDTVDGVAIDKTAYDLDLSHSTVFNMRHKILFCVEQETIKNPIKLNGICEADETYILESVKGRKIPADYHRKPRKHGAVASKRGISNEYVCLCTSVTSSNKNMSVAINRATPSKEEILEIFGDKVDDDTLILCDGNQNYDILEEKCSVATSKRINKVNGFHSFIKERNDRARGFATVYLNRYNALFSKVYSNRDKAADEIYELMTNRNNSNSTISKVKSENLLSL